MSAPLEQASGFSAKQSPNPPSPAGKREDPGKALAGFPPRFQPARLQAPVSVRTFSGFARKRCLRGLCGFPLRDSNPPGTKKRDRQCLSLFLAEKEGFEPSRPFRGLHDFQSCALDQLGDFSIAAPVLSGMHLSPAKIDSVIIIPKLFPKSSPNFQNPQKYPRQYFLPASGKMPDFVIYYGRCSRSGGIPKRQLPLPLSALLAVVHSCLSGTERSGSAWRLSAASAIGN